MASIANEHILVKAFDDNIYLRCQREIKEAKCEAIQFGFTNFMQNFAFALIYLAQAVLVYYFEDYEYLTKERMFVAMFALMFGVFAYV